MGWHVINSLLALLCAGIALGLASFAYRHRTVTGATSFIILTLAVAWMCVALAFELSTTNLDRFLLGAKVEYIGVMTLPVAWLCFALSFSGYERWLTTRNVSLLVIIPTITVTLVWTNELHGLIWDTPRLRLTDAYPVFEPLYGDWFWVNYAYVLVVMVTATIFLLRTAWRSWELYRQQSLALLIGVLIPWIGNIATILDVSLIPNLHPTPITFTLSVWMLGWALFRYDLLVIMPLAYDTILDRLPDGVLVLNEENRIVSLNQALKPYQDDPTQQVIGKPLPQAFTRLMPLVADFWQQPETRQEIQVDGRDVDLRILPLLQRGRLFMMSDVTRRKQIERELQQQYEESQRLYKEVSALERLKTDMLRLAAHDLRSPLSVLIGYLQLIEADAPLSENQHRYLREAEKAAARMDNLVRDFLTLERMQLTDSASFTRLDFATNLREAFNEQAGAAATKAHQISLIITPDTRYMILGDAPQLHQAIINLISNAIKYTPNGGQIEVKLSLSGTQLQFEVTDNGYGVPEKMQSNLFNPFFRAKTVETLDIEGTGLGLHLVKRVIERHGGEIIFRSVHGQGSTFGFSLPVLPVEVAVPIPD